MTREKYIATLLGCALGDSLGMAVEGWNREQIQKYIGKVTTLIDPVLVRDKEGNLIREDELGKLKYYTKNLKRGDYTDDTILTLAIAESIIERQGLDLKYACHRQLRAYEETLDDSGKSDYGFGGTTVKAFDNLRRGLPPSESGVLGLGNGPAMKMSPVGLYMDLDDCYHDGLEFAEALGRSTHLDPRSVASGVLQAHAVCTLLHDPSKDEFLDSMLDVCMKHEQKIIKSISCLKYIEKLGFNEINLINKV